MHSLVAMYALFFPHMYHMSQEEDEYITLAGTGIASAMDALFP